MPDEPVISHHGQSADHHIGQAAGQNITNQHGANADDVLAFLREYIFQADQARETTIKRTHMELGIVSDALRGLRTRLDILAHDYDNDRAERARRQLALDADLAQLRQAMDQALERQRRTMRRWIVAVLLILLVALALEAWLLWWPA